MQNIPEATQKRIWKTVQILMDSIKAVKKAEATGDKKALREERECVLYNRTLLLTTMKTLTECGILTGKRAENDYWIPVHNPSSLSTAKETLWDAGFTIDLTRNI